VTVIPCARDERLRAEIDRFAEVMKTQAHTLGSHGLDEKDFYNSGVLRGAVEKLRGEYIGTMGPKREFVQHVLNHLEDRKFIAGWDRAKRGARHDYLVRLNSGRLAVIDLKGCLDGNNTTISERPAEADEFVVWSLCTNPGADPRHNAWSGIHSRLGADMIARHQLVDGLVIWDMVCATFGRPCPKLQALGSDQLDRTTLLGPFRTPPPCIYLFPATIPDAEHPVARAQPLNGVELLAVFHTAFGGRDDEMNFVDFEVGEHGDELVRRTVIRRAGVVQHASDMTAIRRV
jgi:hypothetical protein